MKYPLLLLFSFFSISLFAQNRNCDPVVLTGTDASCVLGEMPNDIVAFKYQNNNWIQIPVQIDERVLLDIQMPYDQVALDTISDCLDDSYEEEPWDILFYADAKTDTGADTISTFDADDELVFMEMDIGDKSFATTYPNGTLTGSVCEIAITEPLDNDAVLGYIYLFVQNGSLDQAAGVDYITYNFTYESNYLTQYVSCPDRNSGGNNNPENSVISTSDYELGFSQRWKENDLKIKVGNNTDILDRHQLFINTSSCNSNEDNFSELEGAHIAAIDGPIRAIRSVMGSASGPFTQLDIKATKCQVDYDMFFRLHPANGFHDVYDMSEEISGQLTYYSEQNPNGVVVDGVGETLDRTDPDEWSLYEGTPGSLIISWDYDTDMTIGTAAQYGNGTEGFDCDILAYYDDKGNNPTFDCTGDGKAYGSSGFRMKTKQCTDRRYDQNQYSECEPANVHYFHIFRTHYLKPAGMTIDSAMQYDQYAKNPLGNIVADGVGVEGGMAVCPLTKQFTNETISMDSTYLAADSIVTDNMVEISSGAAVTFDAGKLVRLKPGFIANNGATFTAKIGGCVPNFNQELEQRSEPEVANIPWNLYPNPLRDYATLEYMISKDTPVHIYLLDLNGKLVKTLLNKNLQKEGHYQQIVDFSQLHTGLYFVVFQSNLGLESRKISIVK